MLQPNQELYHEIFGSILDRTEMTPYLLLRSANYETALRQATRMMGNRGFDTDAGDEMPDSEKERARQYIEQACNYFFGWMFPFTRGQLEALAAMKSVNSALYLNCLDATGRLETILQNVEFRKMIGEDPRHLFLLASSKKYPRVFSGYGGKDAVIPDEWQQAACSLLKMGHLIKSVEEDSQDINDYAKLGLYLQSHRQSLDDLYNYDWENPGEVPESEPAQRAFVKLSAFFHKLKESLAFDPGKGCLVFNSGDGVEVEIAAIKARLKSPESMFTKLGKNLEGEAYDIKDILAITFILRNRDDTLKLFHALQKRGVILQENTASHSITQTLFDNPQSMREATRRLMIALSRSEGKNELPGERELLANAASFFEALNVNASKNLHSSLGHKKFQCKINFSLPIHRAPDSNKIMIPGTPGYRNSRAGKTTEQHTLGVELRISDEGSWKNSEQKGDSHHDAYRFRQSVSVMNRVFKNVFHFPDKALQGLIDDQSSLFS